VTGTVQRVQRLIVAAGCRGVRYCLDGGEATLCHLRFALRHEYHSQRHFDTQGLIFVIEPKCVS